MADNTQIEWNPKFWNPQFWRNGVLERDEARLLQPLRRRTPTTYSLETGDMFHENVPDDWIDRVFAVMALCPQHTFQVLTKRSNRMREYLANKTDLHRMRPYDLDSHLGCNGDALVAGGSWCIDMATWPLPNVWLGVSVEDQAAPQEKP